MVITCSSQGTLPVTRVPRVRPISNLLPRQCRGHVNDVPKFSGYSAPLLRQLQESLPVNIIAMEYPSYGEYLSKQDPSAEQIEADAKMVYQHVLKLTSEDKIIIFGRSMGSGAASYICSTFNPKCLILMSAFASLQLVARDHASFLSKLVKVNVLPKHRNASATQKGLRISNARPC
jgi:surfactin synthase thioesterase subunit